MTYIGIFKHINIYKNKKVSSSQRYKYHPSLTCFLEVVCVHVPRANLCISSLFHCFDLTLYIIWSRRWGWDSLFYDNSMIYMSMHKRKCSTPPFGGGCWPLWMNGSRSILPFLSLSLEGLNSLHYKEYESTLQYQEYSRTHGLP